jgi:hypothetical protein
MNFLFSTLTEHYAWQYMHGDLDFILFPVCAV